MTETTGIARLEQAREAAARGDAPAAYELFTQADAAEPLGADDLGLFADTAYAAGNLDVTIEAWERAHAASLKIGDDVAAAGAAARIALYLLIDTGMIAPVRGWTKRADRLLEGMDDTPIHAWLAVAHQYERLLSGDFAAAREWAHRAQALGKKHGEPGAATLGVVAEARSFIYEGAVEEGLALLDEAAVATMSGELDPLTTGMLYCELICTCQAIAQYDRAEQWTKAYERWSRTDDIGSLGGRCRVHRAELLRMRGSCVEAETEALQACEELRPYLRIEYGWPLTELGRIRLRMGDLEGAEEAFLGAHEAGWDPQPGLALLRLAQGDVAAAASSIRNALDHPMNVPSKELPPNTELRRAPLLEAQVEIAIAAGDLERARWAADELESIASSFESTGLRASAALSRGRVALLDGDADTAIRSFGQAVRFWSEVAAPHEAAVARMGLADAYRTKGDEDRALMEERAARSGLDLAGEDATSDAVAPADVSGFRREGDYWTIVFDAKTFRVRDLTGLRYLGRLLTDPGRELHVLDLVASNTGSSSEVLVDSGAGEMLDTRAKDAYRRRLTEIDEDIEEAQSFGDIGREERANAEREFLLRELSRAVGLSGRDRLAGLASERARASVTRAIRHAMARIAEHNAALGEHLDRTIRTGTYCVYLPDPRVPVAWEL